MTKGVKKAPVNGTVWIGGGQSAVKDPDKAGASEQRGFVAFLKNAAAEIVAGLVFTAIAYFCGWLQLMLVMGISPEAAFLAGVAPFVVVDVLKILAAVACARAVKAAVR